MLQDEMFMADIRANPELYYPDEAPQQQQQQPHAGHTHPSSTTSSTSSSSPSHLLPSHSGYAHSHTGGRGDFSGLGSGASTSAHPHATFRDKFNSLTAAAKKRLLTVATRLKTDGPSAAAKKEYNVERQDLASGLLSDDAGSEEVSVLGSAGGRRTSERVTERDVEPAALSARVEDGPADEGVYTQDEGEGGNGAGYVPPSMAVGDLNVQGKKRIWGRKSSSSDDA